MKRNKIVIYGIGSFAEYVSYILSNDGEYDVVSLCVEAGVTVDKHRKYQDLPIFSFENIEEYFSPVEYQFFIAVGNNWIRERIFNASKCKGYSLISYVSKKAITYENLECGENVFISEGSTIQPFVSIGNNTIIISSSIGHHSLIGNNVLLSCSYLAGNVSIGDNSFLGLNSMVKQNTMIGSNNIIGMGCNVTKNTGNDEVYSVKTTSKRNISAKDFINKYLS
ncbi:acetyltransferase [Tolypothrix sp. PCC 7910]|uniref:acetyltransferase n=1 Tax=Tolypothrix sp. PCC 7910 TaxID=2099387 RepID=UPI00142786F0|nr:acetyltransferase [Tolypothrix sp. PCC 7910]QIR36158.1 acetyltransferase [Tolypothrix sp. PCC 7910]